MEQRKTNVSEENRKRSDAIGSLESLLNNMLGLATFASVFICSFASFTFKPWEFQIRYFGNHPYAIFFILLCFGLGMRQVFKTLKQKEPLLKKISMVSIGLFGFGTWFILCAMCCIGSDYLDTICLGESVY